jgi:hypothetical protein
MITKNLAQLEAVFKITRGDMINDGKFETLLPDRLQSPKLQP